MNLDNSKEFTVLDPRVVKVSFVYVGAFAIEKECFDIIDHLLNSAYEFIHNNPNR